MINYWIALFFSGLGTFLLRFSFLSGKFKKSLPKFVRKTFGYVPVVVLSALAVPEFIVYEPENSFFAIPELLTGVIALVLALKVKSDALTILGGLFTFWFFKTVI